MSALFAARSVVHQVTRLSQVRIGPANAGHLILDVRTSQIKNRRSYWIVSIESDRRPRRAVPKVRLNPPIALSPFVHRGYPKKVPLAHKSLGALLPEAGDEAACGSYAFRPAPAVRRARKLQYPTGASRNHLLSRPCQDEGWIAWHSSKLVPNLADSPNNVDWFADSTTVRLWCVF